MLLMIAVLLFVIIFLFLYSLLLVGSQRQAAVATSVGTTDEVMKKPLYQRLFQPVVTTVGDFLAQLTPEATLKTLDKKITAAGGFGGLSAADYIAMWACVALLLASVSGLAAGKLLNASMNKIMVYSVLGLAFGIFLAFFVLNRRITIRKAAMQKALPGILDLMSVSMQAGLSFDGALAKVAEKMKGPLVDELTRMLQEIRMGISRRKALQTMSDRCDIPDISLFAAAMVQADQLGVSIAAVLKVQADSVREKWRIGVREAAMKAPVKLIFPLVLFIFPAMFVVLLGPAVISIMRSLLK